MKDLSALAGGSPLAANELPSPSLVTEQPEKPPVTPIKQPLQPWDVAQVNKQESPHFGVIFVVGDVKAGKVHGYYLSQGANKLFVTAKTSECEYVGSLPEGIGLVRSRTPCSEQWLKDLK